MLQESNSKLLLENDVFLLYVQKGAILKADTPCLVINKNTNEKFNKSEDTLGAWSKFITDWREING